MSEVLAQLEKKGGGGSMALSCYATGANVEEQYGSTEIGANHPFHKLKVVSYLNLNYEVTGYPYVRIGGTQYNRPTVGTEYDITGKTILLVSYSLNNSYQLTGINVELS